MEPTKRKGESPTRGLCSYPLTAKGVVQRVYTDIAVLDVAPKGFGVSDMVPGMTRDELQTRNEAELHS